MSKPRRTSWLWGIRIAGVLPLAWFGSNLLRDIYFIDPISALLLRTGRTALIFLFLSLACTPLSFILGRNRLLLARRPLGLYALLYATLHVVIFVGWDYGLNLSLLWQAIVYQQYVLVGAVGLLILAGLGVTSLTSVRRSMGRWWRPFQRLVYLAAVLIVLHVMWQAKEPWEAWREVVVLALLLLVRLPWIHRRIVKAREAITGRNAEN